MKGNNILNLIRLSIFIVAGWVVYSMHNHNQKYLHDVWGNASLVFLILTIPFAASQFKRIRRHKNYVFSFFCIVGLLMMLFNLHNDSATDKSRTFYTVMYFILSILPVTHLYEKLNNTSYIKDFFHQWKECVSTTTTILFLFYISAISLKILFIFHPDKLNPLYEVQSDLLFSILAQMIVILIIIDTLRSEKLLIELSSNQ